MKTPILVFALGFLASRVVAGPYAPAVGEPGSTAVARDSAAIVGWATGVVNYTPGWVLAGDHSLGNISEISEDTDSPNPFPTFTDPARALGKADVVADTFSTFGVVSLGDGGAVTLEFAQPITNGPGFDLAVFENAFSNEFLELAFVEVSSDGTHFYRFPSVSLTSTQGLEDGQADDFSQLDPTDLHNLAGKYLGGYGTPFDLADLAGIAGLDISRVTQVRILDVVGSVNPLYGTVDSQGRLIKDPYPTRFGSGGFDLDAVAVLHQVPEPGSSVLLLAAGVPLLLRRRR